MTDINKQFVKYRGVNEIPVVSSPNSSNRFLSHTVNGKMEQTPLSVIYAMVQGVKGTLKLDDTAPTVEGKYELADFGEYENLVPVIPVGSSTPTSTPITTEDGYYNAVYFDGTNFIQIKSTFNLDNLLTESIKPYELPDFTNYSQANVLLLNDKRTSAAGYITKVKLYSFSAGTAKFQILKRKTSNASSSGQADYFEGEDTFEITDIQIGLHEYVLDSPIAIGAGRYLAQVGGGSFVQATYSNEPSSDHLGWFQGSGEIPEETETFLIYEPFTATFDYTVKSEIYERVKQDPIVNVIVVERNEDDYNSIRDTIKSITDASETNQYIVFIPPGEWRECDLFGKDYITIRGAGVIETIILTDPLGDMADFYTPSDYYYPSEANKKLSLVNDQLRHIINVRGNTRLENLTLYAKNSKYPAHIDDSNYKSFFAKNVRFKSENCNYPIGIGFGGGQNIKFENCIIERVDGPNVGVFVHNRNNQKEAGAVTFDRCKFQNCNLAVIDELGSGFPDLIAFRNCFMSDKSNGYIALMVDKDSDGKTFWINPNTGIKEPNPVNVPYCIVIDTTGTPVQTLVSNDSGNFNPSWTGIPQRDVNIVRQISLIEEV